MEINNKYISIKELIGKIHSSTSAFGISGLNSPAKAYIISKIFAANENFPIVVLTSDMKHARILVEDLQFYSPAEKVKLYPALNQMRNDLFSSEVENIAIRNAVLKRVPHETFITVSSIMGFLQKTLCKDKLEKYTFKIEIKNQYKREELVRRLNEIGYVLCSQVEKVGEYAIRGALFDIFVPSFDFPVRIEFLGDEVESIKYFDSETQMTVKRGEEKKVIVVPVREVVYIKETINRGKSNFKKFGDTCGIAKMLRDKFVSDIENEIYFSGIDYFLSFFEDDIDSPLSHYPDNTLLIVDDQLSMEDKVDKIVLSEKGKFEEALKEERYYASFESQNVSLNNFFGKYSNRKTIYFDQLELENRGRENFKFNIIPNDDLKKEMHGGNYSSADHLLDPLIKRVNKWLELNYNINFVSRTSSQAGRIKELLSINGINLDISEISQNDFKLNYSKSGILIGGLTEGFRFQDDKIVFVTDEEIFGERKHIHDTKKTKKSDAFITSFSELKEGDFIVHVEHGIGIFKGIIRIKQGEFENDFLLIQYKDNDKLYIPVYRLNILQKYIGGEHPQIDKLGGTKWQTTKKKVKESLFAMASELMKIYAVRVKNPGFQFLPPDNVFKSFEATFPFEETTDQLKAIDEIIKDMISDRSTDRLVCGDVGYGKTEVAIRAAFLATLSGKQVAVLVPTTLLAEQHYRTFKERLKGFPASIEMISRFRTLGESKEILNKLEKGEVDIIIGTHRLLSKDVKFNNMGLLLIDEEQRFGVEHKEILKDFRALQDVITFTATPIPRTLHLSLMGIRDISIINTPPLDRLSVRTFVSEFNEGLIRESILREIKRGGQVFFLHNSVKTIETMAEKLRSLVPEVKFIIGHGQMSERTLENVMRDFINKKYDVLISSTIIENGIDIPSANTMIINRADTFGLSQLYQLRGRVGRSKERAYCYLLIPKAHEITPEAKRRLTVIKENTELGSGFKIASHDLEIRGGGNILGKDQSGHIAEIGFDLYNELLEETIAELKGEELNRRIEPELKLNIPAFIPDTYISATSLKLLFYKKISSAKSEPELDQLELELRDRFGIPPDEVINLLGIMAVKIALTSINVREIHSGNKKFVLTFDRDNPNVKVEALIDLVTKLPRKYAITPEYKLIINLHRDDLKTILLEIKNLMKLLDVK